jgi:dienelactone hydrolase
MANVVLFHHAQGLTEGVHAFAEKLRAGGHHVTTPDLFEGARFDKVEERVEISRLRSVADAPVLRGDVGRSTPACAASGPPPGAGHLQ